MAAAITRSKAEVDVETGDKPLVTAITIFLNAERFFEEAIQSVFDQTYDRWELLLVDDGSTDESTRIARWYADSFPDKVRLLEHAGHENRGMSASRNLGLEHARGEYVAFLDADDVWVPEKLEQQVEILNSHPEAAMVLGATRYWYSWTGNEEDSRRDFVSNLRGIPAEATVTPPTLVSRILRNPIVTTTGCLARRQLIQEVGGYEERFRGMFEDQVLHSKLLLKQPAIVSDKLWYKYRRHPDSCCAVAERNGKHHSERIAFLDWLDAYSSAQGVDSPELRSDIRRERWKSRHPMLADFARASRYRVRLMTESLKSIVRRSLPLPVYRWLQARRHGIEQDLPVGSVSFGNLRRVTPVSRKFGYDRGTPVDRCYIEGFLSRNAADVRGRVLEVGDDAYTRRFGGDRPVQRDVLHVSEGHPQATVVADLTSADHIPSNAYDCIILTQTLQLIYDVRAALATLHRILKPGGVLLATMPGISQIDHYEWGSSWYWSFTDKSARRLFGEVFRDSHVRVETHGNVLVATAFLQGLALEELQAGVLDYNDPDYQLIIAVRAVKEG